MSAGPTAVQPFRAASSRGASDAESATGSRPSSCSRSASPPGSSASGLDVQNFLLPPLSDILETLWDDRSGLLSAAWFTFKEALGGFVIGSRAAILVALCSRAGRPLASAIMPYAIAANAIPIIAFAPITNNWFGLLSPASKIAIAAIICFFPVLVNTLMG